MKRLPSHKRVKFCEFNGYVRIPGVGLRKEVMLNDLGGVFKKVEDVWEASNKVYITTSCGTTIVVPFHNVRQLEYLEDDK